MKKARTVRQEFALALFLGLAAAVFSPSEVAAAAGGVLSCTVGATCKIGEFLYDDNSAPIAGASCSLTSKYPDNSSYLSSVPMSGGGADGWYYHEFTTPSTTGVYATSVCCTTSGDTLCIDKGFEAVTASSSDPTAIASAVWSYSGRTVTSFGTLIADIWANATRTLTGVGLSSGQLATQDDVTSVRNNINNLSATTGDLTIIKSKVDESRLLLEKVVNKPIIENVLEDTSIDLSQKIKDSKTAANQLFVNNQYLTAQTATLTSKWNGLGGEEALEAIIALSDVVGEPSDGAGTSSMFASLNYLKDSWGWDEVEALDVKLTGIHKSLSLLKESLADYQKTPAMLVSAKGLVKDSLALEKVVGSTSDKPSTRTLFAKIKSTETLASSLDDKHNQITKVLGEYTKGEGKESVISRIKALQNQVIALNKVPSVGGSVVRAKPGDDKSIKNSLLSLLGVVNSNKKLLSLGAGKTLVNTWLEMGSIVFKTLATNPSLLISQDVEIRYYLPEEIKEEDIIKADTGLAVKYDAEKGQMFAQGTFTLAPGQTRTFAIETKDIWEVTPDEIASLRTEVEDLFKPLEKTAFFAQGVSLKSDAISALDQIASVQATAVTPEDKIRSYREADILKDSVEVKVSGLRELVAQASNAGSMFGFVGGSQTIAVWGLIIIIAAGFIFMMTYMKSIMGKNRKRKETEIESDKEKKQGQVRHQTGIHPLRFAAVVIATGVISAGATGYFVADKVSKVYEEKLKVLGTQAQSSQEMFPSETLLNDAQSAQDKEETPESSGIGGPYIVSILDTPTGFLRVRKSPGGVEIAKVKPEDKLIYLDENEKWYQVELEDAQEGWVSKEYSIKE